MDEFGAPGSPGPSAITNAMDWMAGLIGGSAATAIAVVAVALVGFAMLSGHVSTRRAASVAIGCFLLFGAHALSVGFLSAVRTDAAREELAIAPPPPPPSVKKPKPFNPYSKASMGE